MVPYKADKFVGEEEAKKKKQVLKLKNLWMAITLSILDGFWKFWIQEKAEIKFFKLHTRSHRIHLTVSKIEAVKVFFAFLG